MYQTVLRNSLISGLLNWISTTESSLRIGLTPLLTNTSFLPGRKVSFWSMAVATFRQPLSSRGMA
ncbi:hypothetical protein D9M73_249410 [compost metagenome]